METLAVLALFLVGSPFAYYLAVKLGTYARLKVERDFKEKERKDNDKFET